LARSPKAPGFNRCAYKLRTWFLNILFKVNLYRYYTKGERKLSYDDFLWAVDLIAESKGLEFDEIAAQILQRGPASSGTVADAVKFHDDKSMYTVGVCTI
jgi:hypothetical protein